MHKVGIIGVGQLGEALLEGFLRHSPHDAIIVTAKSVETRIKIGITYPVKVLSENLELADRVDVIILAVKPQQYREVIEEIMPVLSKDKVLVSVTPAFTLAQLETLTHNKTHLIRSIPNTPTRIGQGVTVLAYHDGVNPSLVSHVDALFRSVGQVYRLKEEALAVASTLAGSGPAFITYFVKAMMQYGIDKGLDETLALNLVLDTFLGTSYLIKQSNDSLDKQISRVCSKGGSTIQGINTFNDLALDNLIEQGIDQVTTRFIEMEKE